MSGLAVGLLAAVMGFVLVLPLSVSRVEERLEAFLLAMGALAVTVSGSWSAALVAEALREPVKISLAVLVFGLAFGRLRRRLAVWIEVAAARLGLPGFLFALVTGLGLASSVLTAVIAALALAEAVTVLKLPRERERALTVCACFSIGLGAALTPLGEPLSTITTSRLAGPPYDASFFFLARLLWPWLLPGMLALGGRAALLGRGVRHGRGLAEDAPETAGAVVLRAARVYAFVAGLVLLGRGLEPLARSALARVPSEGLFWANLSSAALDNATLAAVEISPAMDPYRLRAALLGLLAAGGILIPGNIPNIIAAKKLRLGSREWALEAAPVGLAVLAFFFAGLLASR